MLTDCLKRVEALSPPATEDEGLEQWIKTGEKIEKLLQTKSADMDKRVSAMYEEWLTAGASFGR
jgi:hypothetical protein